MRSIAFILFASLALPAAPDKTSGPKSDAKTSKTAVSIPADAVETAPGVFEHRDSAGKTWTYRKTPFGVVKIEGALPQTPATGTEERSEADRGNPFNNPKSGLSSAPSKPEVRVTVEGDTVRFERKTPFGPSRWTKKRSELTAEEREMWEQSKTQPASSGNK